MKLFKAKKDKDRGVSKCPNYSGKIITGYELVNRYYVDKGFGDRDLCIEPEEFLEKVKKGRYYAIIDETQFMLTIGEYIKDYDDSKLAKWMSLGRIRVYLGQDYTVIIDDDVYEMQEPLSPQGINCYLGTTSDLYLRRSERRLQYKDLPEDVKIAIKRRME